MTLKKTDAFYQIRKDTIPGITPEEFRRLQAGLETEIERKETLEYLLSNQLAHPVAIEEKLKKRTR